MEDQVFGEDIGEVVGLIVGENDEIGEVVVGPFVGEVVEVVVHVEEVNVVEDGIEEEVVEEVEVVAVVGLAVGEVEFEGMYQRGLRKDPCDEMA